MNTPTYPITPEALADLDNRFTYHPPRPDQPWRYTALREKAKELAKLMMASVLPSRELSTALTHLETATFWANAGIARNEKPAADERPSWQQRVIAERDELSGRIEKLEAFFNTPDFDNLHPDHAQLMRDQHGTMTAYLEILTERIRRF